MLRAWAFMYLGRRSWCYALETLCILEGVLHATRLRLHVSWIRRSTGPLWKSLGTLCSKFKRWNVTRAQPWLKKRHEMLRGLPEMTFLNNLSTTLSLSILSNQRIPNETCQKTSGFDNIPDGSNPTPSSRRCHHVFGTLVPPILTRNMMIIQFGHTPHFQTIPFFECISIRSLYTGRTKVALVEFLWTCLVYVCAYPVSENPRMELCPTPLAFLYPPKIWKS